MRVGWGHAVTLYKLLIDAKTLHNRTAIVGPARLQEKLPGSEHHPFDLVRRQVLFDNGEALGNGGSGSVGVSG